MDAITEILYQYAVDDVAMFGPDADLSEVDTKASYNAYEEEIQEALKTAYPYTRVKVQSGPAILRVNGMTDHEEIVVVEQIIHEAWEFWNWIVPVRVTLKELGTPLAEIYRGSGRLAGRLVAESAPTNDLDRDTNYRWVGEMTQEEFEENFMAEEHYQCHDRFHANRNCPDCLAAGWDD